MEPTLSLLDDALRRLHLSSSRPRRRDASRQNSRASSASEGSRCHQEPSSPPLAIPSRVSPKSSPCQEFGNSHQLDLAVEAFEAFQAEVNRWRMKGSPHDHPSASNFADYLTQKYLSTTLDTLDRAGGVSRIRRSIASQIDSLTSTDSVSTATSPAIRGRLSSGTADDERATERTSTASNSDACGEGHPFGRGTAWQTITEAKRQIRESGPIYDPPSPAAGASISRGCTSRKIVGAAASPAEMAIHRNPCAGTGPEEHASSSPQSPWACGVCTRTNAATVGQCTICGRSKDATSVGRGQRPGTISSTSPLLQKLKEFQSGSVRADKEVVRCEELSREIQDVLSSLRANKALPPNKKD